MLLSVHDGPPGPDDEADLGGVTTTFTWDGMDMIRESTPTSTTTYLIPEGCCWASK
ncbi:MAG: hypothetical protein U0931_40065 [Vulcanimicrobiota bacterium]